MINFLLFFLSYRFILLEFVSCEAQIPVVLFMFTEYVNYLSTESHLDDQLRCENGVKPVPAKKFKISVFLSNFFKISYMRRTFSKFFNVSRFVSINGTPDSMSLL